MEIWGSYVPISALQSFDLLCAQGLFAMPPVIRFGVRLSGGARGLHPFVKVVGASTNWSATLTALAKLTFEDDALEAMRAGVHSFKHWYVERYDRGDNPFH